MSDESSPAGERRQGRPKAVDPTQPAEPWPPEQVDGAAASPPAETTQRITPAARAIYRLSASFAERFATSAGVLLRTHVHVRPAGAGVLAAGQFVETLQEPTCCYRAGVIGPADADEPAPAGTAWLEFSPGIAFAVVDSLLGGRQIRPYVPARGLTDIEHRLVHRAAGLAGRALATSWPTEMTLHVLPPEESYQPTRRGSKPGVTGLETSPHVDEHDPKLLVLVFEVSHRGQDGTLRLAVPTELAPCEPDAPPAAEEGALMEVSAALPEFRIDPEELAQLAPGDLLLTECRLDDPVTVRVAGIPKFTGRLGAADGRRAVTISEPLRQDGRGDS